MQEMGHTDPALALSIYAHAMRRDEGENERLRALVEGSDIEGLGTVPFRGETIRRSSNCLWGAHPAPRAG
jgi:hypothetical protein